MNESAPSSAATVTPNVMMRATREALIGGWAYIKRPRPLSHRIVELMPARRPVVLVVLDGWGYREEREGNAIALANTPTWNRLWGRAPRTLLHASGLAVGLPEGQMGNSEVGHLNLGAGRVVTQDLVRINKAIADGS